MIALALPPFLSAWALLGLAHPSHPRAQDRSVLMEPDEVVVDPLTETAFRLHSGAANMGLFLGEDGILIVDGGFLTHGPALEAAIARLYFDWRERHLGVPPPEEVEAEPLPLRYVVNTHWHQDHTETNSYFALGGARIIAHPSARRRMMGDPGIGAPGYSPAMDPAGWPVIAVEDSLTLHFNGEEVRILHFPFAHTDGDLVVWLPESKVAFLGDVYWSESFPYIELMSGARPAAKIRALERLLAMLPPDTAVVPGHGAVADEEGASGASSLQAFHDMMADCDRQIRKAVGEGLSLLAVYELKMFGEYEDYWGDGLSRRVKGFIQLMWFCYAPRSQRGLGELEKEMGESPRRQSTVDGR